MVFVVRALWVVSLLSICSCSGSQNKQNSRSKSSQIPLETYIKINKQLVAEEQKNIEDYLATEGLTMERTQTGLWYAVSEPGTGPIVEKGKIVTLDFTVRLLDGTLCYSSEETGHKVFQVAHGGVESGLEEGILMLRKGSKAIFILPPHLGHGLVGDNDKIPARAILRYDLEVLDVKNLNN